MSLNKETIRDLLIECMHSDENAEKYFMDSINSYELLDILIDFAYEDNSEDAQIGAAYWISKFNLELLKKVEKRLLPLQESEYNCISGPIMVSLGRIKSREGLEYLLDQRIGKTMKWEADALKLHLESSITKD